MRPERGKGVEKVVNVRQVLQTNVLTPKFAPGFYDLTYPRRKYGDNKEENPTLIVSIRKKQYKEVISL